MFSHVAPTSRLRLYCKSGPKVEGSRRFLSNRCHGYAVWVFAAPGRFHPTTRQILTWPPAVGEPSFKIAKAHKKIANAPCVGIVLAAHNRCLAFVEHEAVIPVDLFDYQNSSMGVFHV